MRTRPRHCGFQETPPLAIQCGPPRHCGFRKKPAIQCALPASLRGSVSENRGDPVAMRLARVIARFRQKPWQPTRTSPASLREVSQETVAIQCTHRRRMIVRLAHAVLRNGGGTHYIRKDKKTAKPGGKPRIRRGSPQSGSPQAPPALHRVHGRVLRLVSVAGSTPRDSRTPGRQKESPRARRS